MDITAEQWKELFAAFPAPLAFVAPDHRFAGCNRAFCSLVGYGEPELKKRKWQSITHPDDVDFDSAAAEQLKLDDKRQSYVMEKRYLTRANHIIHVRLFVCSITDGDQFVGYFVAAFPATESVATVALPAPAAVSLLSWIKSNPKDAAIVGLATALFLGRDAVIDLIKTIIK
jgi:PAS domain S-box-containing protein